MPYNKQANYVCTDSEQWIHVIQRRLCNKLINNPVLWSTVCWFFLNNNNKIISRCWYEWENGTVCLYPILPIVIARPFVSIEPFVSVIQKHGWNKIYWQNPKSVEFIYSLLQCYLAISCISCWIECKYFKKDYVNILRSHLFVIE